MNSEDLLDDGAPALPFELVWEEVGNGGQNALLLALLSDGVSADGIILQHSEDTGRFESIDRVHWSGVTPESIQPHIERFGSFSLVLDDDGCGYGKIILRRSNTLLDLLDYTGSGEKIDVQAADVAWHKANGQFFGHKVNALVQAALSQGLVEPTAASVKSFLLTRDDLWLPKPPGDEILKKFCSISVKAYRQVKELKFHR